MAEINLSETEQKFVSLCRAKLAETEAYKRGVEEGVNSVFKGFLAAVANANDPANTAYSLSLDGTKLIPNAPQGDNNGTRS